MSLVCEAVLPHNGKDNEIRETDPFVQRLFALYKARHKLVAVSRFKCRPTVLNLQSHDIDNLVALAA